MMKSTVILIVLNAYFVLGKFSLEVLLLLNSAGFRIVQAQELYVIGCYLAFISR